jgi:hypothetical protein
MKAVIGMNKDNQKLMLQYEAQQLVARWYVRDQEATLFSYLFHFWSFLKSQAIKEHHLLRLNTSSPPSAT